MEKLPARHSTWITRCLGRGELAPLGSEDVDELARLLEEHRYLVGTMLFHVGEAPARVHVIRSGRIELSRKIGGRRAVLQVLHSGDVFGDVALLAHMTEPFDALAIDDTILLSADSVALFGLLERRPRLAQRWLVSLAIRMAATQARLVDLLAGGLEAQISAVLSREAEDDLVKLPQALLAELLGARRTSVNRVLKSMEIRGAIRLGYGQIEILDATRLIPQPETTAL